MKWIKKRKYQEAEHNLNINLKPRVFRMNRQWAVQLHDAQGIGVGMMFLCDTISEAKWKAIRLLSLRNDNIKLVV
jgi:hypothetical protein